MDARCAGMTSEQVTRSAFFMGGRRAGERDETLWGVLLHEVAYGWSAI